MNDKRWAKHIIRRFGREGARIYSIGLFGCPCAALFSNCHSCKYNKKKFATTSARCKKGRDFHMLWANNMEFYRRVKRIIKERLK